MLPSPAPPAGGEPPHPRALTKRGASSAWLWPVLQLSRQLPDLLGGKNPAAPS